MIRGSHIIKLLILVTVVAKNVFGRNTTERFDKFKLHS